MHRVGDRVRCVGCPTGPWLGRVLKVECIVCGMAPKGRGRKCVNGHDLGRLPSGSWGYTLIVAQDNVPDDMRPWCLPENFPVVGPSAWERLLADRLVP